MQHLPQELSDPNFSPVQVNNIVDNAAATLCTILDTVALLNKKVINQKRRILLTLERQFNNI